MQHAVVDTITCSEIVSEVILGPCKNVAYSVMFGEQNFDSTSIVIAYCM